MDAREELRVALDAEQDRDEAANQGKAALKEAQERYEQDEVAVFRRLYDAIDVTVGALAENVATEHLPMTPREVGLGRLLRPQKFVDGWKVNLVVGSEYILQPDGTLISPQIRLGGPEPRFSTLREWVDLQRRELHEGFSEDSRNPRAEAFSWTCRPYGGDRIAAQAVMSARLQAFQESVTKMLAGLLHARGVAL